MVCKAPSCKGRGKRRALTLPAPFIVACPSGHIDDFPWREYVHRGPTSCRKRMKLFSIAKTGSVADVMVKCECEKTRSASDAFGERRAEALGPCNRRRPWLGIGNRDSAACADVAVRAMQRGATNAWVTRQPPTLNCGSTLAGALSRSGYLERDPEAARRDRDRRHRSSLAGVVGLPRSGFSLE